MSASAIRNAFSAGNGIFRLAPNWVPRSFCIPGRRIKLHPDDYYALGGQRGGIDERWLGCTTPADNGPLTGRNEGISHLVTPGGELIPLTEAVAELGAELLGERLWKEYGCWPVYSKFFDNLGPLPHHIHHRDEHAKLVGQRGKPECYYFPPQLNNHGGHFPFTFFGFEPGTTKEQVRECLVNFTKGDNKITNLSKAYRLEPGTGWDVPPGVLHAPGSFCTYEPQVASDVYAMYQSLVDDQIVPESLLWKDCPADRVGDFDYLVEVIDWELNVDPDFGKHRFMRPVVFENRFQPFDSVFQLRGTQPEQDIPLPDRPCPARQLRRQVAALGNGHEPARRRNRLPRQRDAPRQRQKQDSRQNHQRGCARKPARPSGGTLRQRPDRPDLPPARINQNAVKLQNHHHHGHRLYKAVIDDQNDRSVQENPVKERPDAETEQQHAVFAARFCAEPEEMPAPALPDVFAGTRHQVFDIHQVAEDVVAVVADERVAVHEKGRNGADRKDIEHRRLPCARRQIGPQQGRDAAEQQLGNDSRSVDQQPFPARQPPAVGGIRVQPRIEHHEPHPDPAHPAAETDRRQRMRRLMDQFQEQNRREVLRQPRP